MKKDEKFEILIEDMDVDGNGIGHADGMAVFVHGAVLGERLKAKAIKVKKNYAVAIIDEFIEKSPHRRTPPCNIFKQCGGCSIMHMDYASQLDLKHKRVKGCIKRLAKQDIEVSYPLPTMTELNYRNKASFPVKQENGLIKMGFYKKRSHVVCDVDNCLLQKKEVALLVSQLKSFIAHENISVYNEETHTGLLRHAVVRSNKKGEMMLTLVINGETLPGIKALLKRVEYTLPELKSIVLSHNTQKGNVIMGDRETVIYGQGFLYEELNGLLFRVSSSSFMQVNYEGMRLLYHTLFEMLRLSGTETVVDLFSGVGTISLIASRFCKKVYGIEVVPAAVKNAEANAALNGIENAEFILGDATEEFAKIKNTDGIDVIIVDPPRKGLDEKLIDDIVSTGVKKVGYVSCDPATFARDIALFYERGYKADLIQPVDMFPQTTHIENVTVLYKE